MPADGIQDQLSKAIEILDALYAGASLGNAADTGVDDGVLLIPLAGIGLDGTGDV